MSVENTQLVQSNTNNNQQPHQMMTLPQDPLTFLVMAPFLPLILFFNTLQSMTMMPVMAAARTGAAPAAAGYYKNDEQWEIWEENGKVKVRVHRQAQKQ